MTSPAAIPRSADNLSRFVSALLLLYVVKEIVHAIVFPPFSGHDEAAHYGYVKILATEGRLPVITTDRMPAELFKYCGFAIEWCGRGPNGGRLYVANHPPLYYALMVPIYRAAGGGPPEARQYLMRMATIPFGALTVLLSWHLVRVLFPRDEFLAVTVPSFVAFQPQISYEAAMVNNDIVCVALTSWVLYLLVVGLRDGFPLRQCAVAGGALGLALLAKLSSVVVVPGLAIGVVATVGWRRWSTWLSRLAVVALAVVAIAGPWYVFLYRTYGNLTVFDQMAQVLGPNWNGPRGTFFKLLFRRDIVQQLFHESWGLFGWHQVPLDTPLLVAIACALTLACGGFVWYVIQASGRDEQTAGDPVLRPDAWQILALAIFLLTMLTAYASVIGFASRFRVTQGRYLFPAINAAAVVLMIGLRALVPRSRRALAQTVIVGALLLLHLRILGGFVIPHWYPRP